MAVVATIKYVSTSHPLPTFALVRSLRRTGARGTHPQPNLSPQDSSPMPCLTVMGSVLCR